MSNVILKKITVADEKNAEGEQVLRRTKTITHKYERLIYSVYRVMQTAFQFFVVASSFRLAVRLVCSRRGGAVRGRKGIWA